MAQGNEEVIHQNKTFEAVTYENRHLTGRVFTGCRFYKSSLKGCTIEDTVFDDCVFEDCDLSLMKLKDTSFSKVIIKNCKAIGVLWTDASNPFVVTFQESLISFGSFYGKHMKKAQFLNCQADEVDFSECNLSQSDFSGTDLRGAVFSNTDLTKANFVDATSYGIDTRTNKITKAKFSMPGAMSFLYALGIEIVDENEG